MSDKILVLYPANPKAIVDDLESLIKSLQRFGFLGEAYEWYGETHYRPGPLFLRYITFLSSHEVIVINGGIDPASAPRVDSRERVHISIPSPTSEPEFLGGANVLPPRCPKCGHYYQGDIIELLNAWYIDKENFRWHCPVCGTVFSVYEMDWRQQGGFGRQQIQIWGVWPGEARLSEEMYRLLEELTGFDWTYCYYRF